MRRCERSEAIQADFQLNTVLDARKDDVDVLWLVQGFTMI